MVLPTRSSRRQPVIRSQASLMSVNTPSRLTTANMSRELSKNQRAAAEAGARRLVFRFPVFAPAMLWFPPVDRMIMRSDM